MRVHLRPATLAMMVCALVSAEQAAAQMGKGPALTVDVLSEYDGVRPGDTARLAVAVTVPEKWHVNAHKPLEDFLIPTELSLELPEGFVLEEVVYPEPVEFSFQGSTDILAVYGGTFHIGLDVAVGPEVMPAEHVFTGKLRYQACNDTQCWAPTSLDVTIPVRVVTPDQSPKQQHREVFEAIPFGQQEFPAPSPETAAASVTPPVREPVDEDALLDSFDITGQAGGYMSPAKFLAFIDAAESGQSSGHTALFENRSLWLVVLLTLIGGLLLNLTPCVLPIIPINLAIIGAGAKSGSRARGFVLGLVYGCGIAVVYGALGLVVVLGFSSFGAINALPWFNFAIALIFILLGIALFDVFLIDFTRFQSRFGIKKEKGSLVFAGLMGMINALLAGACVAPVVIAVVLYSQDAYAKGSPVGLILPFLLGVGMGLPWPLAGAGLSFLPKPGTWMTYVKYAFGVFIIGMGVYYGYLGATLFNSRYLVDREAVQQSVAALDEEGWYSSLAEGLDEARREGKPVLLDFWATWCKNCLTMNNTTLKDTDVRARLDGYVKIKYQAEFPEESPAKEVLARFDYVGLPHYAVLKPR